MQYREFGKTGCKLSALGFGAMRLPVLDDNPANIDELKATEMIRTAIDKGVNYVDTAWPYHQKMCEPFIGRVLQNGYRDKVKLATKLPAWNIKEYNDFDFYFNQQLQRLQTDHIDFYLLHALNKKSWENIKKLGVLDWCEKKKEEDKISYIGFSFHDDYPVFQEIVDAYDKWDFCQIQYNYMDIDFQAGLKGLKYAAQRGMGIIIMEPLRGGQLAKNQPDSVKKLWDKFSKPIKPVEGALHWLWNQPEVSILLSGMSDLTQVEENITYASQSKIGFFDQEELQIFSEIREEFLKLRPIPCTECGYCLPCPHGVNIPRNFSIYNMAKMFNDNAGAKFFYQMLKKENRANCCVQCGECELKCPQQIPIMKWLKITDKFINEN